MAGIPTPKDIIRIKPAQSVTAGSYGTWEFILQPGEPLVAGDSVEFVYVSGFATHAWTLPQTNDQTAPGYVTAHCNRTGVSLALNVVAKPNQHEQRSLRYHVLTCTVQAGVVEPGDTVRIVYGDRSGGGRGAQCQPVARQVAFPVQVNRNGAHRLSDYSDEPAGKRHFRTAIRETPLSAVVDVIGGRPVRLHVVVPSLAPAGATISIRAAALDSFGNGAMWNPHRLLLQRLDQERNPIGPPQQVVGMPGQLTEPAAGAWPIELPQTPGYCYIGVLDPDTGLAGISNPVRLVSGATAHKHQHLYWGDIHAHSQLSDGSFHPDEHYLYASQVALLDFAAVTDHGPKSPAIWQETKAAASKWTHSGSFVALCAHEPAVRSADKSLSYPGNIYYLHPPAEPLMGPMNSELWQGLAATAGIFIPHHTHYGFRAGLDDWQAIVEAPADAAPVVEIYSNHGCSEGPDDYRPLLQVAGRSYQEALAAGARVGVVAGSDYHELPLGSQHHLPDFARDSVNEHFRYRGGLTAIMAPSLDAAALIHGMRTKNCYATTGERIWLRLWADSTSSQDTVLCIEAAGTAHLAQVRLVINNQVAAEWRPSTYVFEHTLHCSEVPLLSGVQMKFAYLRVVQTDGEAAWTSPIWFENPKLCNMRVRR